MDNVEVKRSFFGPKIVFIILGAIIIIELIYAVGILTFPTPTLPLPQGKTIVQNTIGKISLNTPKTNLKVGESVPVSVTINTGGHTISGVDLIVNFDPKILTINANDLVKGKIFSEYPLISTDSNKGVITISGISSTDSNFTGTGEFAVINLKAKSSAKTSLTVDFKRGSTANSNLVEANTAKNILDTVDNLELVIK